MQTPAPSATANGNDELDLVYPFWLQNGSTGGGGGGSGGNPSLNPPFLDPNGPLTVQNNLLKVNTATPITVANKAITLTYDPESLELNDQQQLSVKIDPEGPLKPTADGIQLSVDPTTLEVDADDWELTVNLDLNGPLDATASGITVRVDDTLLIEDDDSGQGKELGVNLNPAGPITADQNGLDLEIDDQTLKVNSGTSGGILAVQIKPQGGLTSQTDGIQVSTQNSVTLNNGALDVKVVADGPLASTANGLTLNYDPSDFTVDAGTLTLSRNPAAVTGAYLVSGSSAMTTFPATITTSSGYELKCSYFLQQWVVDDLITTSLYLHLDRTQFENLNQDAGAQNARYFTFWVPSSSRYNLSGIQEPTITPSTVQWNAFLPGVNYSDPVQFNMSTGSGGVVTTYYEPASGELQTFNPATTGDWASNQAYYPGTVTVCILPVNVATGTSVSTLLCFNFRCANSGLFKTSTTTGSFKIGPILYQCPASRFI